MLIKDFINTSLPLLGGSDLVKEAMQVMTEFQLEHLAACINGKYGFLSRESLDLIPLNTPLAKIEQLLQKVALSTKEHIWVSLGIFSQHESDVLPLLDENGEYCGSIMHRDIFKHINEVFPINTGGAIIEIEMSYQSYSIQELGGIVEGADAKITLLSVFPIDGTSKVNIAFSINKNDASDVIQALERHNYHVNAWFMNKGKIDNILEERYDAFMKYINV